MKKYKGYYYEHLEGIVGNDHGTDHGTDYYAIYDRNMMYVETIKGLKETKQYINDLM